MYGMRFIVWLSSQHRDDKPRMLNSLYLYVEQCLANKELSHTKCIFNSISLDWNIRIQIHLFSLGLQKSSKILAVLQSLSSYLERIKLKQLPSQNHRYICGLCIYEYMSNTRTCTHTHVFIFNSTFSVMEFGKRLFHFRVNLRTISYGSIEGPSHKIIFRNMIYKSHPSNEIKLHFYSSDFKTYFFSLKKQNTLPK